jgi:DNA polymerase III epsilon subunit-like protein
MIFSLIDTETTDLPFHRDAPRNKQPRLVEFAGILTDGRDVIDELEFMVNPGRPIAPDASKISGITDEIVKDLPFFGENGCFLLRDHFIRAQVVIAHNLSFDRGIIQTACVYAGKSIDDLEWPQIEICTVEETMPMFGKPMKLQQLYELKFGEYKQKHRARDDLNLLHKICMVYGIYDAIKKRFAA